MPLGSWDAHLSAREAFDLRRVAVALRGNLRSGVFDAPQIVWCQLQRGRGDVLFEAVELGGAGDRDDLGLLRQQPGERDLRRRRALPVAHLLEQVDDGPVRLSGLGREPRQVDAIVVAAERRGLVDLAGEESPASGL